MIVRLIWARTFDGVHHFEFGTCANDASDVYPNVDDLHQGYDVPITREIEKDDKQIIVSVTQKEAETEARAKAEIFLANELAVRETSWKAARLQEEREVREAARKQALQEKILAEERAKAGV